MEGIAVVAVTPETQCRSRTMAAWPRACGCERCRFAVYKMRKLAEAGKYQRVSVEQGMAALDVMVAKGYDGRAIASACGIPVTTGYNWGERRRRGEVLKLGPRSCFALVTAGQPTEGAISAIVPARKLRALARIGWSCRDITDDIRAHGGPQLRPGRLTDIRRDRFQRAEVWVAALIDTAYKRLAWTPAPSGRAHCNTRNRAAGNKWPSPFAWEDIDDLDCRPDLASRRRDGYDMTKHRTSVDPLAVDLLIAGRTDGVLATRAERHEVVRRMRADGRTDAQIERITGISQVAQRYPKGAESNGSDDEEMPVLQEIQG